MALGLIDKYQSFLEISNAIVREHTRESLFKAMALQIKKVFHYDRFSVNLYDSDHKSLSYFSTAEGVQPVEISSEIPRPLPKASIANLVLKSGKPVIIEDLRKHPELTTSASMLKEGLSSTVAFPLIIRDEVLGSFHFSFKKRPKKMNEVTDFLEELSTQLAVAIHNMLSYEELRNLNERLVNEKRYVLKRLDGLNRSFYYKDDAMVKVMNDAEWVAHTDLPVLLTGETGTGKDHLARYIHNASKRHDHLFVKVNCAALASTLIESELFGHARGSFTGAIQKRTGRFEMADGGTIFLDEIGELPTQSQAKLVQVIEEKVFERVGESFPTSIDFRLITATNQDLNSMIRDKKFRSDLFYRINAVQIQIPPLRDRIEDIDLLIMRYTSKFVQEMRKPQPTYSPGAINRLKSYSWPGNVRELQNLVQTIMFRRAGESVSLSDVEHLINSLTSDDESIERGKFLMRDEMEKRHIEKALLKCKGVIAGKQGAAQLLGMPRSTLLYRMKKLGITKMN